MAVSARGWAAMRWVRPALGLPVRLMCTLAVTAVVTSACGMPTPARATASPPPSTLPLATLSPSPSVLPTQVVAAPQPVLPVAALSALELLEFYAEDGDKEPGVADQKISAYYQQVTLGLGDLLSQAAVSG